MRTVFGKALAGLAISLAFAATAPSQAQAPGAGDTLAKVKASGKVLVGVRNDFPPVGSVDVSGKLIGFGPELGAMIAKRLDVQAEFVPVTSRTRIPLLQNGSIDLEVGVTTPTVEREKSVDFSIPYVWDAGTLIVKKGASKSVKDYAPPRKLATTQGSLFPELVKPHVPNAEFVLFQEYPEAVVALMNGKVDAVATNRATAIAHVRREPNRLDLADDYVKDPWAIMVRKNDSDWRNRINHMLQEMWKDGAYQALFEKHFGEKPNFYLWSAYMLQPGIK